jgi:ribosomal subunit interface protein
MTLRVSGKNVDIGDALRTHTVERVGDCLGRYFAGGYQGHVTVEKEGASFRTECAIHLSSGLSIQTVGSAYDPYPSVDQAVERLEKRLRRHKGKIKDHSAHKQSRFEEQEGAYRVIEAPPEDEEVPQDYAPIIIAETTKTLKSLTVGAAVLELDLTGSEFIMFRHASHGGLNLVYRRRDGNIGWIDPSLPQGASNGSA